MNLFHDCSMHRSPRSNNSFPSQLLCWSKRTCRTNDCVVVYQSLIIHFAIETITFDTSIAPAPTRWFAHLYWSNFGCCQLNPTRRGIMMETRLSKVRNIINFLKISDQQTNPKENACMSSENDALKHHEKRFMILLQIPDLARIRLAPYEIPWLAAGAGAQANEQLWRSYGFW